MRDKDADRDDGGASPSSPRDGFGRNLLRHRSGLAGLTVFTIIVVAGTFGPFFLADDPIQQDLSRAFLPPSSRNLLGTDQLGRDVLTRIVYGTRYSLGLGVAAVVLAVVVGTPIGAVSGYFGGRVDMVVQRLTDALLSFPGLLLALALIAGLGTGATNLVLAVGVSAIPTFIRLVRGSALKIRELPYVEAARALGFSGWSIIARHVIPNSLTPVIVQGSLQMGTAILIAAGLGFLGLGITPPTPEWGSMLGEARNYIFSDARLVTIPGVAISVTVLALNLVGDGLRDVLDPRLRR